jgi:apolipoprotein N-acyltransferase
MRRLAALLARRDAAAILALVAGAAAALAFPPFGFLPGLFGYGVLMLLLDAADGARLLGSGFWRGWLAGTAFFLASTWWISEAFYVDATKHGWQAPFAVGLIAAGLGLFWGLAGLLYRVAAPTGPLRVLVFAGAFCIAEWLRGHILTGFPWNLAGSTWAAGSAPSQAASLIGAYALSWVTVAIAAAPALLLDPGPRRGSLVAVTAAALTFAGLYAFGTARLAHTLAPSPAAPVIRVVQANVKEQPTYTAARFAEIVQDYVRLTAEPAARTPDVVVWPEGAIPDPFDDYLAPGTWTRVAISGALRPGQSLIAGGYRIGGTPAAPSYFNSLIVLRRQATDLALTGLYDKHRLVPFGEYLPFATLLRPLGIDKLVNVGDGFTPGPRPAPIQPAGLPPVQPLICYESLFPRLARGPAAARAQWIVNVSDDAWFGRSYGPLQHLNLARYRAIEQGLPIVRATPTGVSAIIDAYGRILPGVELRQGQVGVIDSPLPAALKPTLYEQFGDLAYAFLLGISVTWAIVGWSTHRQFRQKE